MLNYYLNKLIKLRTALINGKRAPHKPVLLLAVIAGISKGEIKQNKIYISPELVASFKDIWCQLVNDNLFSPNFSLPFYHLISDKFWHIKTFIGREILLTSSRSIKSFSHLKEVVDYAYLDQELYILLQDDKVRKILEIHILNFYFPKTESLNIEDKLIEVIKNQILHEHPEMYKAKAPGFDEEEIFIRGGVFKKQIPRIYNYSCCISGMRVIANRDMQMIDACHIIPFSESGDDTIGNGISLCPNLHRAFDRGLISIGDDYKIIINSFHEDQNVYSIKQFEGKEILLPKEKEYYPNLENIKKHREKHCSVIN